MSDIPDPQAPIDEIWEYAKKHSKPNGQFDDWMEWIGWGGVQYGNYKESGKLLDNLDELHSCLLHCYARDQVSNDFHDGDPRQEFPRAMIKRIRELDGAQ